ncbi:MAG: DUF2993 domain-containing protein [Coleofasciculaceae cyanobacterium]
MVVPDKTKVAQSPKSQIISKVLSPALQLWLKAQVEEVDALHLQILCSDRQILNGNIPHVSIAASRAIYQGLHLSQIQIEGRNIRFNLGQVLKGQPLRLLESVAVTGQLVMAECDLQASLASSLFSNALTEFLNQLLHSEQITHQTLTLTKIIWRKIEINTGKIKLIGTFTDTSLTPEAIMIEAGIQLVAGNLLRLHPLEIKTDSSEAPILKLNEFWLDLGSEVNIFELTLAQGQLMCNAQLNVLP